MSKQLTNLRKELARLERELAEYQHINALGRALQLLPRVQELRARVAKASTMTIDQMRSELASLERQAMSGYCQGLILGTLLNRISDLRRQLQAQEQAQSIPNFTSDHYIETDDDY
jgi:hypothetical protein